MPDTLPYMLLGYGITAVTLIGMVVFLVLKVRQLRAELKMLQALEEEGQTLGDSSAQGVRDTSPQHRTA